MNPVSHVWKWKKHFDWNIQVTKAKCLAHGWLRLPIQTFKNSFFRFKFSSSKNNLQVFFSTFPVRLAPGSSVFSSSIGVKIGKKELFEIQKMSQIVKMQCYWLGNRNDNEFFLLVRNIKLRIAVSNWTCSLFFE